jgi:hypothetical protein
MTCNRPSAFGRTLGIGAGLLAVATLATACGGGSGSSSAAPPASPSASTASPGAGPGGRGQGGARPGTTGTISQVNPTSIFVVQQAGGSDAGGQVTVNFGATTTFTKTAAVSASALKVGDCVTASARPAGDGGARPTTTPSPAATRPTSVAATTVTITSTSGTCTATGFGGGGGNGGGGTPNARRSPRVRPSGAPSGGNRFGGGFGGFNAAFGTVSSVTADGFVVSETGFRGGSGGTATPAAPTSVTVTTTAATTYDETASATKAALVVGQCATAVGTMDDTGAVTARTIAVRPPTNGTCSAGFGGFGRSRGGAPSSAGA